MTDDRGQSSRDLRHLVAADGDDEQHGDRTLGHVEQPETAAQRKPTARDTLAPPVRPLPTVRGSARRSGANDDPKGDAAQQVPGDQGDADPDEVDGLHGREV